MSVLLDDERAQSGSADTAALATERELLLDLLLVEQGRQAAAGDGPPLARRAAEGEPPLSFAQQRLWVLDQMVPGNPAYNIATAVRLEGELAVPALARGLAEIVARHESLRTIFPARDGVPAQLVLAELAVPLPLLDPPAGVAPESWAAEQIVTEARRPFQLATGPLLRCLLLRLGARSHILVATAHHIVSDGWSMGILTEDLGTLYAAFAAGRPSPLGPPPLQYADFAVWQRRCIEDGGQEPDLAYWRHQLAGEPAPLALPFARPRPPPPTFAGAALSLLVPAPLAVALRGRGRQAGATLFGTLLTAFGILLHRYSGQADLVVGTPVAGRSRPELERVIGFFVNTLALRLDLSGEPTAAGLLARAAALTLDAFAHQELPFDKVVEALHPAHRASHSPLFQTMLVLQNAPVALPRLPALRLTRLAIDHRTAKFDLTLKVEEQADDTLAAVFEYNSDLFDSGTIARLGGHWTTLLAAISEEPGRRVAALPLLTAAERRQLAARWWPDDGRTPAAAAPPAHVHRRFEAQAARLPAAPAVADEDERLSYSELNARANQLAHHLIGLGIAPESRVALLLERSATLVVALLAVLKAGGAYVPLDPEQPAERLGEMLADADPAAVVTASRWLEKLPPVLGSQLVLLDVDAGEIDRASRANPDVDVLSANPAYVIYTSGSTGAPKGVVIPHAALANYVSAVGARFDLGGCASFALVSTPAADLGHTVLFPALAGGGCLHVPSRRRATDAAALGDLFAGEAIDCLKIVPSHLAALLRGGVPGGVLPRRRLILGGEPLDRGLVARIAALAPPGCRIANHYGPTETTVGAITGEVEETAAAGAAAAATGAAATGAAAAAAGQPLPAAGPATVPLTRPLDHLRVYLLDAHLELVPLEVRGEIYLAGAGLSRGYLHDPAKTAAAFLPDPFAAAAGERMYRSGDLARLLPGGELVVLGRGDRQVKIQGFRVEPAEIEAALERHPGVLRAVVTPHPEPGPAGGSRLVAYVVGRDGGAPSGEELRPYLAARLPSPMVPSLFVPLASLPLTANGKLDRGALPAPETAAAPAAAETAPTPVEEVLCAIWAGVLGVRQVAPQDNFFDLGGHSVLATQVVARIQETFRIELPLLSLFELPTPAGLARRIEMTLKEAQSFQMPALAAAPGAGTPPLSFAQQRLWFLHQLDPQSSAYNMAGKVLIRGPLALAALGRGLSEIARRHAVLRATFPKLAGWPAQRQGRAVALPLPEVSLLALPAAPVRAETERLALAEAQRPFDLGRGPLLRVALVRLGAEEYLLLLTLHHIVADGWSVGIVLRELTQLYAAFSQGQPSPLPELALQYGDFARWQRQWMRGEVLAAQLGYWRRQLAGLPPALPLPTDRPFPALQSTRGARLSFTVPAAIAESLRVSSRQRDVTFFMTLLGAWETLLYRCTGQADFAVGTPIAGRNRSELEELVGLFINTLALRADLSGEPAFTTVLARVRAAALGAYAHQDLPFEHLVEGLEVGRDLARPPIFQTMFVWQSIPTPLARLAGLVLVPLESDTRTAKFELTLALQEMKGSLLGSLEYSSDLFDAPTAMRTIGHLQVLLAAIAADGDRPLHELPLLSAAELAQLVAWNDTRRATPGDRCLHQLVAAQCARTPGALAVSGAGEALRYDELDARADRLAQRLQALGVGPEVVVGVCLERTPLLLVALLAVLKAGGAYLPLDPSYPAARLAFMLADSAAPLLLSERRLRRLAEALPPTAAQAARIVLLDADAAPSPPAVDMAAGAPAQLTPAQLPPAPPPAATPDNLAYVIYTSGSTGWPKGVQVSHRALVNFLASMLEAPGLASRDVLAAVTSLSFDIAALEVFLPLLAGARCDLVPRDVASDGQRLAAHLAAVGATVVQATPATWRLLAEIGWRGEVRALCGGEALPPALAADLLARADEVWNLYGPTETTVWSTAIRLRPGERVTIGRPIANTRVALLDAAGQPVAVGAPGALFIGGGGLARGYRGRPELTAERFLPDPGACEPGNRFYATGDVARYLTDGRLELLGRADQQVKVRGVRIEPAEIEAVAARHPAVAQAVVLARDDQESLGSPSALRLVAYVVPRPGCAVTYGELREHLARSLPEAMLPAALVTLAAMPLTPNGKLDRRALPAPGAERPELTAALVAPRNAVERALAAIWAEALRVDRVGIHDSFFELGGNSLLAVRLMALIALRLGVELPLSSLFQGPTVGHLARLVAEPDADALWSPLVAIRSGGSLPPFFCVHPNGGDVLCYEPLARLLGPEQPFYGLQAGGLDGRRRPLRSMREIAALYVAAMRERQPAGPYRLGGWSFGGVVAYEMAQQLTRDGEEVALLAILDSLAPVAGAARGDQDLSAAHWASWFMLIGRELELSLAQPLGMSHGELLGLAPEAQLDYFVARLKAVAFLPAAAVAGTGAGFWRVHEANTVALWDYASQAVPYGSPITLLNSEDRLIVGDSWSPTHHDLPDLGWSALAAGGLEVVVVPGNHNTLLRSPVVEVVAERLGACLARAAGRG